jgi:hypothetical protein
MFFPLLVVQLYLFVFVMLSFAFCLPIVNSFIRSQLNIT